MTAHWPLRVMTFNVSGAVRTDGRVDLAAVADRIRSSGADVVALQEVYRGWPLAGTVDAAGWLQHELGWHQVWAPAADRQAGNLLLSRVRLSKQQVISLPRGGGSMNRSAAAAVVDVAGTPVLVVDTHLQHRNSAASMDARQAEMRVLLRAIGANGNVVLLGDLNPRNPDLVDLRTLTGSGLTTAVNGSTCTSPTSNDNCSDYVFVGRGLTPVTTVVLPWSPFDHRPLVAEIARASTT
jgi:endonuclease/exonuclease/phosphatase family metal-dependent hydrolase